MPVLVRIAQLVKTKTAFAALLLLGIAACVAFPVESDVDLSSGATPPQRFFVLVAMPKEGIVLRSYGKLAASLKDVKEYSFLLPHDAGSVANGDIKVGYRVQRKGADSQVIEVSYQDEEAIRSVSTYEAVHRAVKPLRVRESHPAMGIVRYVVPAVLLWGVLWGMASVVLWASARRA